MSHNESDSADFSLNVVCDVSLVPYLRIRCSQLHWEADTKYYDMVGVLLLTSTISSRLSVVFYLEQLDVSSIIRR